MYALSVDLDLIYGIGLIIFKIQNYLFLSICINVVRPLDGAIKPLFDLRYVMITKASNETDRERERRDRCDRERERGR